MTDLVERCAFLSGWAQRGPPAAFWLGAFFFPPAFTTAALQVRGRAEGGACGLRHAAHVAWGVCSGQDMRRCCSAMRAPLELSTHTSLPAELRPRAPAAH